MFFIDYKIGREFTKGVKGWGIYDTAQIGSNEYETVFFPLDPERLSEAMAEDEAFMMEAGCGEEEDYEDFFERFGAENFVQRCLDEIETRKYDDFLSDWGSDLCEEIYDFLESYSTRKKAEKGHAKWCKS